MGNRLSDKLVSHVQENKLTSHVQEKMLELLEEFANASALKQEVKRENVSTSYIHNVY